MSQTVTVNCWKCQGSGRYAAGVCYGCGGTGRNTYTAAAYARRQAAATQRAKAQQVRNAAAREALEMELAEKDFTEMLDWVREVSCIGHDGLLEDWVPGSETETERITPEEKARRMMAER